MIYDNLPLWYWATLAGVFGLLIGSFLNVVIYRVPAGESLMGRSHCPKCNHMIRGWDNVPVFSWIILRAKCRDCKQPISWRYPVIEATHAAAWVGIVLAFQYNTILIPILLFFVSVTFALTMIDFDTMRLPNSITYPAFIVVIGYLVYAAAATNSWVNFWTATIASATLLAFYFTIWFLSGGRGLGFGDVKLAPTLGLLLGWFGWGSVIVGTFSAFVVGGIPAAILLATGVLKKGTQIPFGPMLLLGTWIGILWGEDLSTLYLQITGLA